MSTDEEDLAKRLEESAELNLEETIKLLIDVLEAAIWENE